MEKHGITLVNDIFEAKEIESDPRKCHANLEKRITHISKTYGIEAGFTCKSWSILKKDDTDWFKCICGHLVRHSYIFQCTDSAVKDQLLMRIGSVCVDRYNTNIITVKEDKFDTEAFDKICPQCTYRKFIKDKFCGGEHCVAEERKRAAEKAILELKAKEQKKKEAARLKLVNKIENLRQTVMLFGKYKGTALEDIDDKYLSWIGEQQANNKHMKSIQQTLSKIKTLESHPLIKSNI
jgi:uncharacterized protein (DUF3820 family)